MSKTTTIIIIVAVILLLLIIAIGLFLYSNSLKFPAGPSFIRSNETLKAGSYLTSPNRSYRIGFMDGFLCVFGPKMQVLWSSPKGGNPETVFIYLQEDGNLSLKDVTGSIWYSMSHRGNELQNVFGISDSGKAEIYTGTASMGGGRLIWSS